MKKAILGKKLGMTQMFSEDGALTMITVVEAGPCIVVQKKTKEKDGYDAVQVGFLDLKEKHANKPLKGHFEKSKVPLKKVLREFRLDDINSINVGDTINAGVFQENDKIDVVGTSKGKGFAGTVKRYGTHRGPMSHGSGYHRGSGSMGANSSPSKVMKLKKLPGHMGNERVTIQNLKIIKVDTEKNLLLIKGQIPGSNGSLVMIKNAVKDR